MRRTGTRILDAVLMLLLTSACAASTSAAGGSTGATGSDSSNNNGGSDYSDDPASLPADRDGAADVATYATALDAWQSKCKESRVTVAGYVDFAYDDLRKNGVGERSRLVVMRHLTRSVPNSATPTNCQQITAAYLTLREQ